MKIFHTADWHLGKIIHGVSMLEEQEYMIEQFIDYIKDELPDVVIIAGDLYDRAIPPSEAVTLFDYFLEAVVLDLSIPVIAIAGNHDSPSRLHFANKLMRDSKFYIIGQLEKDFEPIIIEDDLGEVHFHPIPFVDPSVVRYLFEEETIKTFDDALAFIVGKIRQFRKKNARHVLIGHYFVTPTGEKRENTSDSERVLSIGGVEYVNASHFTSFDYVALGHLHKAHYVLEEHIRYAGSPLKYSISEEHHVKGFYVVEMDGRGSVEIEKRRLTPRRDMRTVEGKIEAILQMEPSEDYVFAKLLNRSPVLSPMEKIRSIFPNTLHLERPFNELMMNEEKLIERKKKSYSDFELFTAFYEEVKGHPPDEAIEELFKEVLNEMNKQNEESPVS